MFALSYKVAVSMKHFQVCHNKSEHDAESQENINTIYIDKENKAGFS